MNMFKAIKNAIATIGSQYHQNIMDRCVEEIYNAGSESDQKYWAERWMKHSNKQYKFEMMLKK